MGKTQKDMDQGFVFSGGMENLGLVGFLFHMFFLTRSFVDSQVRLFLFYFWRKSVRKDTV